MTYHDEVYEELNDLLEPILVDQLIDALPRPLLLTEDGRFMKVEVYERDKDGHWEHVGDIRKWVLDPPTRFRIVEDPAQ